MVHRFEIKFTTPIEDPYTADHYMRVVMNRIEQVLKPEDELLVISSSKGRKVIHRSQENPYCNCKLCKNVR